MSMLCIFGFCIPYSVLWPLLLLAVKQVADLLYPRRESKKGVASAEAPAVDVRGEVMGDPSLPVTFEKSMDWKQLTGGHRPIIVRFSASWCKPCQELLPFFELLCRERGHEALFVTVDVDEFDEIAALNGAISIPLFVSYKCGVLLRSYRGKDESKVREFVDQSLLPLRPSTDS